MLDISTLAAMSATQQKEIIASVDASQAPRSLRRRFSRIQNKQGGFTLLELLVVISIIAVLGGLAIGAFGDKTSKAAKSSATNTMASLQSAVLGFQAASGVLPNNLDSLVCTDVALAIANTVDYGGGSDLPGVGGGIGAKLNGKLDVRELPANMVNGLVASGIGSLRYGLVAGADSTCDNTGGSAIAAPAAIADADFGAGFAAAAPGTYPNGALVDVDIPLRGFDFPAAGGTNRGRGFVARFGTNNGVASIFATAPVQVWKRGNAGANNIKLGAGKNDVLVALGLGNNSTIATDPANSALASTAFYADVGRDKYARYLMLVKVGTATPAADTQTEFTAAEVTAGTASDKAKFIAMVDPRGDFLDEEYAEATGQKQ